MSKIKKTLAITKRCIKEPKLIGKGFQYIRVNGIHGIKAKVNSKINPAVTEKITEVKPSEPNVQYDSDIKFSIVMPVYNVEIKWLEKAIESVKRQNYVNWEICMADDCSTKEGVREYLKSVESDKIKVAYLEKNQGISGASNAAAALATGDYIVLMDNDDAITYDALYEFLRKIKETDADIVYSDQNIIDEFDNGREPLHKPDWSPDLFLSQMYIGHLLGFKKSLFDLVGGFRTEFNGSQDYDLVLRMIEHTDKIEHVSKVLYGWRDLPSSTATNPGSKPYAQTAGLNAIQSHLDRIYGEGKATALETEDLFVYDVRYHYDVMPKVSVIIPTKDHVDLLKQDIDSIEELTTYKDYEIIVLDNNSEKEESFKYFEEVQKQYSNVTVHKAAFGFNWSKLNNYGMTLAKGDVYVFMNNDMKLITPDWLERLAEKAMRDDVGIVGGLLLYEDDTIQHAGVVVGIQGWADHIYKGMKPVHYGSPYVSPMVTRNVTACTGALMAISKKVIERIGGFDEDFIICGSDIEICIRAYLRGYVNIYDPHIKLYHYESKSRDSYIPEVDFEMSAFAYRTYREEGDPYYNCNLDYNLTTPTVTNRNQFVKMESDVMRSINEKNSGTKMPESEVAIAEILKYEFRKSDFSEKRINLLVPSINPEHVFGGISTALKFFEKLIEESGYCSRIILTDATPSRTALKQYKDKYTYVKASKDSDARHQIVGYSDRYMQSIPVSENDYFMFTGWWTAYCTQEAYLEFTKETGIKPNKFINFIQDYEPGFYPWSSRYLLADSTYRNEYPQLAVFNSKLLHEFFIQNGYSFYKEYEFDPVLNGKLKEILEKNFGKVNKKKQILVYGRPSVDRNAFSIVVSSLKKWVENQKDIEEWEILSAGEYHLPVDLGRGKELVSVGKLTIEQYAQTMLDTYAGISLMSSPHPSYPPLEMSVFGIKVITNNYSNKDLSSFNSNITSVASASPSVIAAKLNEICDGYSKEVEIKNENPDYIENTHVFDFISDIIKEL
ncbi:glycosyltransferase family 2 protein [Bovifimicola ammoniilytica]|uniref:glycosyltransferase family 2 protein n=1 Tax=Bovifimicola ammoniilytica TaxID=2981720 RepID=UPI0008212248|nr:glycosyltransferase family 2 protein [Bovifimicola ammoniilytica]MCU6752394.1 glycosyltransferase family 2 protein [Bovifimicola ammoniilytica]SCJ23292.1 Chondroitin polymerase [uncultured Eubacterium sp.]